MRTAFTKPICRSVLSVVALMGAARPVAAIEVTVQNDTLQAGQQGAVQAGFVAGESAASWLTSPCNGSIVAVQILWKSAFSPEPPSLEDSITIFAAGSFPFPGSTLLSQPGNQPAILEGPVMTDGFLNEFRFLDEAQTIPLNVPVTQGQVFVVSFKFFNTPNQFNGPSVVTDTNGCQAGKNAIFAIPGGWINPCALGMSGDFVIRAVVLCPDTGACCIASVCSNGMSQQDCVAAGGTFLGANTTCNSNSCRGACCIPPSSCVMFTELQCDQAGGEFHGIGSQCGTTVCFPIGACCLQDGSCLNQVSIATCDMNGGVFQGNGTACATTNCPVPLGRCCFNNNCIERVTQEDCNLIGGTWGGPNSDCSSPTACDECQGDITGDNQVNIDDLLAVIGAWGPCPAPPAECDADLTNDNQVNIDDLLAVIGAWGPCE